MNHFEADASSEWRPDDLMRQYHDALSNIRADHDDALLQTSTSYDQEVYSWLHAGLVDVSRFDSTLEKPEAEVAQITGSSRSSVDDVVSRASGLFVAGLSQSDERVWHDVRKLAASHGVGYMSTVRALQQGSSPEARDAMRAALDDIVWHDVKKLAASHGVGYMSTIRALQQGSSPEARNAMRAALDDIVWHDVRKLAVSHGVGYMSTIRALQQGSSPEARNAMRAALDDIVWHDVRRLAAHYGVGYEATIRALQQGSSREVRDAMRRLLPQRNETHSSGERPSSFGNNDVRDFFTSSSFRTGFYNAEGQHRPGAHRQSQQTTPPRHESPRAEVPRQRPAHEEAVRVVGQVAANKQFSWLAREDIAAVTRVITTVRALRKRAADNGEQISDKEVYIRYRWAIEKPDSSSKINQSFRILDAMMGGKPGGRLPF
jgi:hypothetical protein